MTAAVDMPGPTCVTPASDAAAWGTPGPGRVPEPPCELLCGLARSAPADGDLVVLGSDPEGLVAMLSERLPGRRIGAAHLAAQGQRRPPWRAAGVVARDVAADGVGKRRLFSALFEALLPGGVLVLAGAVRPALAWGEPDTAPDRPARLADQLRWLGAVGFAEAEVFWLRDGYAVCGGRKPRFEAPVGDL
jgi:hypothetical protein